MPDTARVLKFPQRNRPSHKGGVSSEQVTILSDDFIRADASEAADISAELLDPDVLFAICRGLRKHTNTSPAVVAVKAASIYTLVEGSSERVGLFDETEFLLGDLALIASGAERLLGKHKESAQWLDRAEAAFRHTVNSAPQLCNVAYSRLALRFQTRQFDDVLESTPSLAASFEKLAMLPELRKTQFLEAMALKQTGCDSDSFAKFGVLAANLEGENEPALLGQTLIEVGGYLAAEGNRAEALQNYCRAAELLSASDRPMALAHLKVTIGESLRAEDRTSEALKAFREAVEIYTALQMATFAAYTRIFVADTLLALDKPRQAEWEILAALPTIEEQKMVPEGFAAVALLKESVRRRKTDPNALRELREHLQKQN